MCGSLGETVRVMDGKELGPTHTTLGRLSQTRHEYSNVFVKRRVAWAKPESTPSHKANECTRGRLTHRHTRKMLTYTHERQNFE